MKPTLTLILTLIVLACDAQTDTTKSKLTLEGTIGYDSSKMNLFTNNKNKAYWQYNNGGNQFLYSIKADGTIELGDLIIDAVVKGLEKKGYRLIKVGGSVTPTFDIQLTPKQ